MTINGSGTIRKVFKPVKGNDWTRTDIVVTTEESIDLLLSTWNNRFEEYQLNEGMELDFLASVQSRQNKGQWFTNLTLTAIIPADQRYILTETIEKNCYKILQKGRSIDELLPSKSSKVAANVSEKLIKSLQSINNPVFKTTNVIRSQKKGLITLTDTEIRLQDNATTFMNDESIHVIKRKPLSTDEILKLRSLTD